MNILVADDNKLIRDMMNSIITSVVSPDTTVDFAINGKCAIECAINKPYDLIFMDIFMEPVNGITATEVIRKDSKSKNAIIVGFSAITTNTPENKEIEKTSTQLIKIGISAGINFFLNKPISRSQVRDLVQSIKENKL